MTLLYIGRNYNLDRGLTTEYVNALVFVCKNRSMNAIKFMIDIYSQQKLSLRGAYEVSGISLERYINSNPQLNNKRIMIMYLNSLEMEVFD